MNRPEPNKDFTGREGLAIANAIKECCDCCGDDGNGCENCKIYDFAVMNYVFDQLWEDADDAD
jgi:hypothetical protein